MFEGVVIDVPPGDAHDSRSGLQTLHPRIWGSFHRPANARIAAIISHPTSNFMGHYLLKPLADRGIAALGLNTRYAGNDESLIFERAILDLGAGVRWLHSQGFERVLLIGNSGGGAFMSFYQAQAEALDIEYTPAGDPVYLTPSDLPPCQGIVLSAAHLGRARLLESWIDPAVIDEGDPLLSDPELDMFNPANGPPFSEAFIATYRAAQRARLGRIEAWVAGKLSEIRRMKGGPRDMAFVIHRTLADPRCLDPALDPNDRMPNTTVWGPPREQNYAANSMGRFTTLTSFLSQWSRHSRADGPSNLARTSVPVLLMEHTADASTFPSDHDTWSRSAGERVIRKQLKGGTHYLSGQPELVAQLADSIADFAASAC
jgi:pimeloyl-ACP methyl ester carboxylesterase